MLIALSYLCIRYLYHITTLHLTGGGRLIQGWILKYAGKKVPERAQTITDNEISFKIRPRHLQTKKHQ